jgi:hypothetical protein
MFNSPAPYRQIKEAMGSALIWFFRRLSLYKDGIGTKFRSCGYKVLFLSVLFFCQTILSQNPHPITILNIPGFNSESLFVSKPISSGPKPPVLVIASLNASMRPFVGNSFIKNPIWPYFAPALSVSGRTIPLRPPSGKMASCSPIGRQLISIHGLHCRSLCRSSTPNWEAPSSPSGYKISNSTLLNLSKLIEVLGPICSLCAFGNSFIANSLFCWRSCSTLASSLTDVIVVPTTPIKSIVSPTNKIIQYILFRHSCLRYGSTLLSVISSPATPIMTPKDPKTSSEIQIQDSRSMRFILLIQVPASIAGVTRKVW